MRQAWAREPGHPTAAYISPPRQALIEEGDARPGERASLLPEFVRTSAARQRGCWPRATRLTGQPHSNSPRAVEESSDTSPGNQKHDDQQRHGEEAENRRRADADGPMLRRVLHHDCGLAPGILLRRRKGPCILSRG